MKKPSVYKQLFTPRLWCR